jgi:hypothetical protein
MRLDPPEARRRAAAAEHGILATRHPERGVDAVPVCFAIDGPLVGVPIDRLKPKGSGGPPGLQRERNLAADPRAILLCERWDGADWGRLWWVRLELRSIDAGLAAIEQLAELLQAKYPQYAAAARTGRNPFQRILAFEVAGIAGWAAAEREHQ